jgi:hypothetical protein
MSNEQQQNQEFTFETPFDVIPLPSKGLLYPGKTSEVKVEYLTAEDENILTSPNLIRNGKVLDILLEKKLKDSPINYRDMLVGDRNAIMIWLRATGYGEMYPVKLTDPDTGVEFDYEIDLSALGTKELKVQPDELGEFKFELPRSKKTIKFKLLTVAEESNILQRNEKKTKLTKSPISESLTYRLQAQIKEIEGNRDPNVIAKFVSVMPAYDSLKFREYSDSIEPGIELEVDVEGPSGPFRSYIPIGLNFFWPNARV